MKCQFIKEPIPLCTDVSTLSEEQHEVEMYSHCDFDNRLWLHYSFGIHFIS